MRARNLLATVAAAATIVSGTAGAAMPVRAGASLPAVYSPAAGVAPVRASTSAKHANDLVPALLFLIIGLTLSAVVVVAVVSDEGGSPG